MLNLKMYYGNNKSPGPIIMIEQSKTGITIQITFITVFSGKCTFISLLQTMLIYTREITFLSQTAFSKLCKYAGEKLLS